MERLRLEGMLDNNGKRAKTPFYSKESLEVVDQDNHILISGYSDLYEGEETIVILPEWVDDIVAFLIEWKAIKEKADDQD